MHRLGALAFAFALLALAPRAHAQLETDPEEEPLPGATDDVVEQDASRDSGDLDEDGDATVEDGADGAEAQAVGTRVDYEPDQRGTVDDGDGGGADEEPPAEPAPMEETEVRTMGIDAGSVESEGAFFGGDFELWLGGGLTALEAIENANLVRPDQQGGIGSSLGLSAGLRLGPIAVGPRFTITNDAHFALIAVGVDVRAVIPTGSAVAATARLSLSGLFLFELADRLPSQHGAGGLWAELGVGVRWFFDPSFSLGVELAGGYVHLDRQPVTSCSEPCSDGEFDLRTPGTADGLTLRLHLSLGARF